MLGLKTANGVPAYRGLVLDGNSEAGCVTAAAWSPTLECGIAYVRFGEAGDWVGRTLSVQTADDEVVDCEIVELPFYDREKKIPRGLV